MNTLGCRKLVLFFGAFSASFVALAAEAWAQPRSASPQTLSAAISAVLDGPFHGDHASADPRGRDLPLSVVQAPFVWSAGAGFAAPVVSRSPNTGVPLAESGPSLGKVMLVSTIGAAAGWGALFHLYDRCPDIITDDGDQLRQDLCMLTEMAALLLPTTLATGGAALAGTRFWPALGGSALGFLGGWLAGTGSLVFTEKPGEEDYSVSAAVFLGVASLTQAAITTWVAN